MSGRPNAKMQYWQPWEQWLDSNLFVTLPTLNATAMNVVRIIDWLKGRACGEQRRKGGHFARLAPNLSANKTPSYAGAH